MKSNNRTRRPFLREAWGNSVGAEGDNGLGGIGNGVVNGNGASIAWA